MQDTEIVIIGSGATGSLLAAHLGEAGRKVVVLEGGPNYELTDLYSSTIWARRLKWHGPDILVEGKPPTPTAFDIGWGRGGAALHHYACWLRHHPEDFKVASLYGKGLDWPIEYDELRPYYDRLQTEIGVSGDAAQEVWRPAGEPYPMPPQPVFRQGELLAAGFAKKGMRVSPVPMAINSVDYNGRPACIQDGWCDAGCPTGALANPITVFGERIKRAGVEMRYDSFVSRILTDASGRRATGVEYIDSKGQRRTINAKLVIVAAFSIQTPRLLLASANDKHPNGLANSSGLVGHYFYTHKVVTFFGMFAEQTDNYLGRTAGQLISQDQYLRQPDKGYVAAWMWRLGSAMKLADFSGIANTRIDLCGSALAEFLAKASKNLANMSVMIESIPQFEDRIELAPEKDKNGLPLARIVMNPNDNTEKAMAAATPQGLDLLRASGATEVWAAPPHTEHMMGGTIMGRDAKLSVANSYGQTHDIENLFLTGPGLFPTGGAVNPTFTASALAARTGEHIIAEWNGLSAG